MVMRVAELNIAVDARTEQLEQGLRRARGQVRRYSRQASADLRRVGQAARTSSIVLAGAFAGITAVLGRQALEIDRLSRSIGTTAEEYQVLAQAFRQAGLDGDGVAAIINRTNEVVAEARDGNEGLTLSLNRLGLSYRELETLDPSTRFATLVDALNGIPDATERSRIGLELFQGEFERGGVIFTRGSEGLEEIRRTLTENGGLIPQETIDRAADFARRIENLTQVVGANFFDGLSRAIPQTSNWGEVMEAAGSIARRLGEAIGNLTIFLNEHWRIIVAVVAAWKTFQFISFVTGLATAVSQLTLNLIELRRARAALGAVDAAATGVQGAAGAAQATGAGAVPARRGLGLFDLSIFSIVTASIQALLGGFFEALGQRLHGSVGAIRKGFVATIIGVVAAAGAGASRALNALLDVRFFRHTPRGASGRAVFESIRELFARLVLRFQTYYEAFIFFYLNILSRRLDFRASRFSRRGQDNQQRAREYADNRVTNFYERAEQRRQRTIDEFGRRYPQGTNDRNAFYRVYTEILQGIRTELQSARRNTFDFIRVVWRNTSLFNDRILEAARGNPLRGITYQRDGVPIVVRDNVRARRALARTILIVTAGFNALQETLSYALLNSGGLFASLTNLGRAVSGLVVPIIQATQIMAGMIRRSSRPSSFRRGEDDYGGALGLLFPNAERRLVPQRYVRRRVRVNEVEVGGPYSVRSIDLNAERRMRGETEFVNPILRFIENLGRRLRRLSAIVVRLIIRLTPLLRLIPATSIVLTALTAAFLAFEVVVFAIRALFETTAQTAQRLINTGARIEIVYQTFRILVIDFTRFIAAIPSFFVRMFIGVRSAFVAGTVAVVKATGNFLSAIEEFFLGFFMSVGNGARRILGEVIEAFLNPRRTLDAIAEFFAGIGDFIVDYVNNGIQNIRRQLSQIPDLLDSIANTITSTIASAFEIISDGILAGLRGLGNHLLNFFNRERAVADREAARERLRSGRDVLPDLREQRNPFRGARRTYDFLTEGFVGPPTAAERVFELNNQGQNRRAGIPDEEGIVSTRASNFDRLVLREIERLFPEGIVFGGLTELTRLVIDEIELARLNLQDEIQAVLQSGQPYVNPAFQTEGEAFPFGSIERGSENVALLQDLRYNPEGLYGPPRPPVEPLPVIGGGRLVNQFYDELDANGGPDFFINMANRFASDIGDAFLNLDFENLGQALAQTFRRSLADQLTAFFGSIFRNILANFAERQAAEATGGFFSRLISLPFLGGRGRSPGAGGGAGPNPLGGGGTPGFADGIFHEGGVVGGGSIGAETPALLQVGEMVLTRGQQARLFEIANGGGVAAGGTMNFTFAPNITGNVDNATLDAIRSQAREISSLMEAEMRERGVFSYAS